MSSVLKSVLILLRMVTNQSRKPHTDDTHGETVEKKVELTL